MARENGDIAAGIASSKVDFWALNYVTGFGARTISLWFKCDSVPDGTGGNTHGAYFYHQGDTDAQIAERLSLRVQTSSEASPGTLRSEVHFSFKYGGVDICDGVWHHIVITTDGTQTYPGNCRHYVDGVEQTSLTEGNNQSLKITTDNGSHSTLGATAISTAPGNPRGFSGCLAEIAHWSEDFSGTDKVGRLADGASPDFFPGNRLFYIDYLEEKVERESAMALTTDGANTVVPHPRIYYPVPAVVSAPVPTQTGVGLTAQDVACGAEITAASLSQLGTLGAQDTTCGSEITAATLAEIVTVPALLSPLDGASEDRPDIVLSWSHPTAVNFDVEVYLDAGLSVLETSATNIAATSFNTGDELDNDRTYYWRVRENGTNDWTDVHSFDTDASPVQLAHPSGRGAVVLDVTDVTPGSLYWFVPYRAADFPEVDAGLNAYFALYSTDHDNGNGGIYWGTFSNPDLSDFTEQGLIWDASDSGGSNDQTETPCLVRNPDDATRPLYLFFHEEDNGTNYGGLTAQQTRLITSAGGILHSATWVDEGAVMPHSASSPHTGYQHVVRRGTGDWVSWGLDQGGASASFAFRTSSDGKSWAIDTEPLPNTAHLPLDPHDKYQLSSFGWIGRQGNTRYLLTGIVNDGAFGGSASRGRIGLALFPTDVSFGEPFFVLVDMEHDDTGSETDNLRSVFAMQEGETLHAYYQTDNNIFYATATVDALLESQGLFCATEITPATLSQSHSLSPQDITCGSEITASDLSQDNEIGAQSITCGSEITAVTLGQAHTLTSQDITCGSEVTAAAAAQQGELLAQSITCATEITAAILSQSHSLSAQDISCGSEVTASDLSQDNELGAQSITCATEIETPVISQAHTLTPQDITCGSEITASDLSQDNELGAQSITCGSEITAATLGQAHTLTSQDITCGSEVTAATAAQQGELLPQSITCGSEITAATLGQSHALGSASIESATEHTAATLGQSHALDAQDVTCGAEVTASGLGQVHILTSQDIAPGTGVSQATLSLEGQLSAPNLSCLTEIESASLSQAHALVSQGIDCAASIESAEAAAQANLVSQDVTCGAEIGSAVISQAHALVSQDIGPAVYVDVASMSGNVALLSQDIDSAAEVTPAACSVVIFIPRVELEAAVVTRIDFEGAV